MDKSLGNKKNGQISLAGFCLFNFIVVLAFGGCTSVKKLDNRQPEKKQLDLYVLMGQSNMAGRGTITDSLRLIRNDRVLMLTKDFKWVPASHPVHFDKPKIAGVGPGLSFGITMAGMSTDVEIGLVPCAVGGTSIDKWQPGAFDQPTSTHPYDDAVVRITEAMKNGKLKGVLWLQGEGDSNERSAPQYLQKLELLIRRIRTLAGDENLPFIAGELGRYKPNYQLINAELHKLPGLVPYTAVVSSEGLTDKGDGTHFDAKSADNYGIRFAVQMKRLLEGTPPAEE
jgi:hypothetical protein